MNDISRHPAFKKRMILMLVLVGILVGGMVGFNLFKAMMLRKYLGSAGSPPQTVSTIEAAKSEWVPEYQVVGSLRAVRGVDISPEIAGTVHQVLFHSGQTVKAGQLLLEFVDDSEKAQIKVLEAAMGLARITLQRDRAQLAAQAVSQAQVDSDAADLQAKEAQLAQQAALLAKKNLTAPFDGRLGITTVNPGQYLNPGDKVVTLQEISPILVDFNVPQQQVGRLAVGGKVTLASDAWPDKTFSGRITAVSPLVDASTRNVSVEARLDNAREELLPGMFGKVRWTYGQKQSLITLPQSAVTFNPYGTTVFVIKPAKPSVGEGGASSKAAQVAEQIFVTTGPVRGDQVAILSGLEAGSIVVTSGQMKLKTGTPVIVNNSLQPANDPAPRPQEQ